MTPLNSADFLPSVFVILVIGFLARRLSRSHVVLRNEKSSRYKFSAKSAHKNQSTSQTSHPHSRIAKFKYFNTSSFPPIQMDNLESCFILLFHHSILLFEFNLLLPFMLYHRLDHRKSSTKPWTAPLAHTPRRNRVIHQNGGKFAIRKSGRSLHRIHGKVEKKHGFCGVHFFFSDISSVSTTNSSNGHVYFSPEASRYHFVRSPVTTSAQIRARYDIHLFHDNFHVSLSISSFLLWLYLAALLCSGASTWQPLGLMPGTETGP